MTDPQHTADYLRQLHHQQLRALRKDASREAA